MIFALLLSGCKSKKKVVSPTAEQPRTEQKKHVLTIQEKTIAAQPSFISMQAQKSRFSINYEQRQISSNGTISLISDSLFIIALQPILGIELYRLEATKSEVLVIDKMNKRYASMTYPELQKETGLPFTFADIQAIVMNRLFVIGKPQSFFLENDIETDSRNGQSTLAFREGRLTYSYVIDEHLLMPLSVEATMDGNKGVTRIQYKGHSLTDKILFPAVMEVSFKNDKTTGSAEIALPNLSFNRQTITRLKINNYKKTTLGAIIPGL